GADLYNNGDWNGCYREFQGALLMAKPFLAHNKDAQKAIEDGLARAAKEPTLDRKAYTLHEVIDDVRDRIDPNPKKALWDRLGGEKGCGRIVDDFFSIAMRDPRVNFTRNGKFKPNQKEMEELRKTTIELISESTGGPLKYTGKPIKEIHKGMGITNS